MRANNFLGRLNFVGPLLGTVALAMLVFSRELGLLGAAGVGVVTYAAIWLVSLPLRLRQRREQASSKDEQRQ